MDTLKLTEEQIEEIAWMLHEDVQFYDSSGKQDNNGVGKKIETALKVRFGFEARDVSPGQGDE